MLQTLQRSILETVVDVLHDQVVVAFDMETQMRFLGDYNYKDLQELYVQNGNNIRFKKSTMLPGSDEKFKYLYNKKYEMYGLDTELLVISMTKRIQNRTKNRFEIFSSFQNG